VNALRFFVASLITVALAVAYAWMKTCVRPSRYVYVVIVTVVILIAIRWFFQ
jgi:hypothetical protein